MNYIWDILLKADKNNVDRTNVKFVQANVCSPYMEIAFDVLNDTSLPEDNTIEVNENYRFYEVFKDLFNINYEESEELREVLLDILLHHLAELDLKQGMSKTEFYKKFFKRDIINKVFGETNAKAIQYFDNEECDVLLNGLITLYNTGTSLQLFNKVLMQIFKNSIVYSSKENPKNMYIYLGETEKEDLESKCNLILDTFLDLNMNPLIFWNQHFGILGFDNTMKNDEIVMVE